MRKKKKRQSGFSLIELMVTVAIIGILLAVAVPSFADFVRASRGSTVSSAFLADMARARSEAIGQNVCVKICQSTNVNTLSDAAAATCVNSGDNWQRGWIIFRAPTCNAALDDPVNADVLAARVGEYADFELFTTSGSATSAFMFDPRGVLISGANSNLTLRYVPDGISSKHSRSVCVSFAGRVTVRTYGGTSGCTN